MSRTCCEHVLIDWLRLSFSVIFTLNLQVMKNWVVVTAHGIGSASPVSNCVRSCACEVRYGALLRGVQSVSAWVIQVVGECEPCSLCLFEDVRASTIILVVAPFCMPRIEVASNREHVGALIVAQSS